MAQAVKPSALQTPSLLPPSPSYSLRYRDCALNALRDFLAFELAESGQDLEKQVAIVRTAASAYVIAAIFAAHYWCHEQQSIRALTYHPHQHCQLMQPTLRLPRAEMDRLCDVSRVQEEEYLFRGDLSREKNKIQLLMQEPHIQRWIDYIFAEREMCFRANAIGCLFVILGVKPAWIFSEAEVNPALKIVMKALLTLLRETSSEQLIFTETDSALYFVNEHPFPSFDPRSFWPLNPSVSLTEGLKQCLNKKFPSVPKVAMLSYLLGYGPTFEAFMSQLPGPINSRISLCGLSQIHYCVIGKVLYQHFFHTAGDYLQWVTLGFAYHSQLALLQLPKRSPVHPVDALLHKTGTDCVVDGIGVRTDYFKKSYTLKKWVMETYFSELSELDH